MPKHVTQSEFVKNFFSSKSTINSVINIIKQEPEKQQKEASKGQKTKSDVIKEQPKPQTGKKDNFFKRLFSK